MVVPLLAGVITRASVAITLFGPISPVVLVCTVGVLTEVPVMLILVNIVNKTKSWFEVKK